MTGIITLQTCFSNSRILYWILFLIGIIAVITLILYVITLVRCAHYRRIIKEKNKELVSHIIAEKELEKEVEHAHIEKDVIEKIVLEHINH